MRAPDEWTSTFTDPRLCAAIVDRLTFDAHIITTGTDSYRLRTAQARRQPARTGLAAPPEALAWP
jgi:DNA replication protein DnaC